MQQKKAVILLSGGLDSATTLAIAANKGFECHAISIYYGQKHKSELDAAKNVAAMFNTKTHKIVNIGLNDLGGSALVENSNEQIKDHTDNKRENNSADHNYSAFPEIKKNENLEIPNTYVPARNTTFLAIALGYAEIIGAYDIFIGACQVDYSGYPDCREEFIKAFENVANLATKAGIEGRHFKIHAPLLNLPKAKIIELGVSLGVDYSKTISCYRATIDGISCGTCDSCHYRINGFKNAGIKDPTKYIATTAK